VDQAKEKQSYLLNGPTNMGVDMEILTVTSFCNINVNQPLSQRNVELWGMVGVLLVHTSCVQNSAKGYQEQGGGKGHPTYTHFLGTSSVKLRLCKNRERVRKLINKIELVGKAKSVEDPPSPPPPTLHPPHTHTHYHTGWSRYAAGRD
jgi:hypothetical protein